MCVCVCVCVYIHTCVCVSVCMCVCVCIYVCVSISIMTSIYTSPLYMSSVVAAPSNVVKCLWEVFVWGVVLFVCVCVCRCRGCCSLSVYVCVVCVCSVWVRCVSLPSGGGSSVGPSPLCGSPVWVPCAGGSPMWVPSVWVPCVGPLCGSLVALRFMWHLLA